MKNLDDMFFESKQRIEWFINGININGLSAKLFSKILTERIVELYNVKMSFFKKN